MKKQELVNLAMMAINQKDQNVQLNKIHKLILPKYLLKILKLKIVLSLIRKENVLDALLDIFLGNLNVYQWMISAELGT